MELEKALATFDSISIESLLDRAALMDRSDRKFVFDKATLVDIL
ncbi:MAG: hypothetical protein RI977_1333, partial [Bacteroidota bacterium]